MGKIYKDRRHHHYWIEDGELFETYETIRGLRYRHLISVPGFEDDDNCNEEKILKIEKEILNG
jgi:hypothetical protein